MGSSRTRARIQVPCIGRWILNHCFTREVPINHLLILYSYMRNLLISLFDIHRKTSQVSHSLSLPFYFHFTIQSGFHSHHSNNTVLVSVPNDLHDIRAFWSIQYNLSLSPWQTSLLVSIKLHTLLNFLLPFFLCFSVIFAGPSFFAWPPDFENSSPGIFSLSYLLSSVCDLSQIHGLLNLFLKFLMKRKRQWNILMILKKQMQ